MAGAERRPLLSIIGRKNSGKTTLLVALSAELRRRGLRIGSVKHGHHDFEIDQPGRDSWRHVHEGGVEAVLILTSGRVAMVMNTPGEEPDVREAVARHFGGLDLDLVLVEGYKHGDLPKIEIHRRAVHDRPLLDAADARAASSFLAIVSDDPALSAGCPAVPLDPRGPNGEHVRRLADLVEQWLRRGGADA